MATEQSFSGVSVISIKDALEMIQELTGYSDENKKELSERIAKKKELAFGYVVFPEKTDRVYVINAIQCSDPADVNNVHLTEWFELALIHYLTSGRQNEVILFGDTIDQVQEAVGFIDLAVEQDMTKEEIRHARKAKDERNEKIQQRTEDRIVCDSECQNENREWW